MMNRLMAVTYHFLLEIILGFLFLFFFYIRSKELPPILILFGLCLGGLISLIILLEKFKNKGKWFYFAIVFPVLLAAGTNAHFSVYAAALLGLFIFWRGVSLYGDFTGHSETLSLFLTFLVGILVIIYSAMIHYPYQGVIVLLLISQILLVLAGMFLDKWNKINEDKLKFALSYIKIIGGASIIGIAITIFMKYIELLFFGIFQTIAMIFAKLVTPILTILELILGQFGKGERVPHILGSDMEKEAGKFKDSSSLMIPNILYFLLLLIAVAYILHYIYKKRLTQQAIANNDSSFVKISERSLPQNHGSIFKKRVKPPEDAIRREIFQLEKYGHKLNLGRFPFETLDDWWQRVGLIETGQVNKIYEKIRYGASFSSLDEQTQVKEDIYHIKQQLKNIAKKQTGKE